MTANSRLPLHLVPLALLTLYALHQALLQNNFQDFFIYRAGAERGLRGESPYQPGWLKERILEQYPEEKNKLAVNAGFFQPPGGIVVFAPFALLPYPVAKVAWAVVNVLAAWAVLSLLRSFADPPGSAPRPTPIVLFAVGIAVCLNFLTVALLVVGQTTLLCVGCVAAGQWLFERGRPVLGCVLWSIVFVKPHIALPLVPLAWYLGGWKRAAGVVLAVGTLTLIGCLLAGGSPLFLRDYLDFLATSHKSVEFNKAEFNTQITSWNRLWNAAGGTPVIELTTTTTLAGYLVWYGLVLGRCAVAGLRPSPAWALAASATGALVCSQVLGYECFLLVLLIPHLRDLATAGRRVLAGLIVMALAMQVVPFDTDENRPWRAPRAVGVATAAMLLFTGPVRTRRPTPP